MFAYSQLDAVNQVIRLFQAGNRQGWHANGSGSISYRMAMDDLEEIWPLLTRDRDWSSLGCKARNLAGEYILVTAHGAQFRELALAPCEWLGILEISADGENSRVCWGFENNRRPPNDFAYHVLCHSVRTGATAGRSRFVYHAHPAQLLAASLILPQNDREITRALWTLDRQAIVAFPGGIGYVLLSDTGVLKQEAITNKLEKYEFVITAHDGAYSTGDSVGAVLGLLQAANKAAETMLLVYASGVKTVAKLSDKSLLQIAAEAGLTLNREFIET